jgi:hypothetical protein
MGDRGALVRSAQSRLNLPGLGEEQRPPPSGDLVPWVVTALVALTVAVGLVAGEAGYDWGAPLQPLTLFWDPLFSLWLAVAVGGVGISLLAAFRLYGLDWRFWPFAAALFVLALVSRLALNLARTGPEAWYHPNVVRPASSGRLEYLAALEELKSGVGPFLDSFAELVPTLPLHVAGHPPGLVVLLDLVGLETPEAMSALTIVVGALLSPLVYLLGRRLFDEQSARLAGLLSVFVPTALLYGATAADALFATMALASACLLLARRRAAVIAGAILLAVSSFFSYALLVAGGWAGIVRWRRDGWREMVFAALACGAALVALYALLAVITGFDVLASIQATHDRYFQGVASIRPYLFYFFGSPAAFLVMLGPVAWYASRSLGSREITAVALAVAILVTVLVGYTKAETERIWIFFIPMACLAAARALPERHLRPVLVAMTLQALVIEVLFRTMW